MKCEHKKHLISAELRSAEVALDSSSAKCEAQSVQTRGNVLLAKSPATLKVVKEG